APKQFFGRYEFHGQPRELSVTGMLKPALVNRADVVDGIENDINKIFALNYLREPADIRELRFISLLRKVFENFWVIARQTKNVEVFGIPEHLSVVEGGESTAQ